MEYKVLTPEDVIFFQKLLGENNVLTSELENYSRDCTEHLEFYPDVVLKPQSADEISKILHYCYENLLPVTPRGAGTGLAGGALPIKGGVVLSV